MAMLHFERDMKKIKEKIKRLFLLVEQEFETGISALFDGDIEKAQRVIRDDSVIDALEVEIEDDVLKVLALQQPVGKDLRHIYTLLKINHELERVGDKSVHIAERAIELTELNAPPLPEELRVMAQKASRMLQRSVDCVLQLDQELAREVWAADREINELKKTIIGQLHEKIERRAPQDPWQLEALLHIYSLCFIVERMGDNIKNIAKQVIYTVTGEIMRHKSIREA